MSPMLRQGSRSKHVQRLQAALAGKGFNPGPVDGEFGPTTERAVREFQRAEGLGVDGIVGPMTWEALLGPAPAASGHRLSDRGVDFIARFEGFRGTLYNDPPATAPSATDTWSTEAAATAASRPSSAMGSAGSARPSSCGRTPPWPQCATTAPSPSPRPSSTRWSASASTQGQGVPPIHPAAAAQRRGLRGGPPAAPTLGHRRRQALPRLVTRRETEAKLFTTGRYQ
jgi:peptidoglycan hydrolase-like protein with peptidoglycan-binding domain